jgi:hypothetical protein
LLRIIVPLLGLRTARQGDSTNANSKSCRYSDYIKHEKAPAWLFDTSIDGADKRESLVLH